MKKLFTLLFCVTAMAFAAHADNAIDQLTNILLGNETSTSIMSANYDINNDGILDIQDLTTLIDLTNAAVQRAPRKNVDIDAIISDLLNNKEPFHSLEDLIIAIDEELGKK